MNRLQKPFRLTRIVGCLVIAVAMGSGAFEEAKFTATPTQYHLPANDLTHLLGEFPVDISGHRRTPKTSAIFAINLGFGMRNENFLLINDTLRHRRTDYNEYLPGSGFESEPLFSELMAQLRADLGAPADSGCDTTNAEGGNGFADRFTRTWTWKRTGGIARLVAVSDVFDDAMVGEICERMKQDKLRRNPKWSSGAQSAWVDSLAEEFKHGFQGRTFLSVEAWNPLDAKSTSEAMIHCMDDRRKCLLSSPIRTQAEQDTSGRADEITLSAGNAPDSWLPELSGKEVATRFEFSTYSDSTFYRPAASRLSRLDKNFLMETKIGLPSDSLNRAFRTYCARLLARNPNSGSGGSPEDSIAWNRASLKIESWSRYPLKESAKRRELSIHRRSGEGITPKDEAFVRGIAW